MLRVPAALSPSSAVASALPRGRCRSRPRARSVEIVAESADVLLGLAASVPREHRAAQRRRLVRLAARAPIGLKLEGN